MVLYKYATILPENRDGQEKKKFKIAQDMLAQL